VSTKVVVSITLQFHSPVLTNILILKVRTTFILFRPTSYKQASLRRSMNSLQKLPVQVCSLIVCFSSQMHALETCACWKFLPVPVQHQQTSNPHSQILKQGWKLGLFCSKTGKIMPLAEALWPQIFGL